jgi:alpha-L-fucosidase
MTMPAWWGERRFGLLIEASAATVPAWAPIGENASWYRSQLGEDVADVVVHPSPMVEVLAHHRDRWGHVERYDDFVPLLHFDRFDAEAWAELVREAGAGYAVQVAKHHDGWTWWDAPGGTKRLTEHGPRRDVVAEFAAACERNDIVFGAAYSLLDWGDERYPHDSYVDEVLHPQVIDLVERYGSSSLRGDGEWAHDAGHWKTAELMRSVREIVPDIVIDDRWRASTSDVPEGAPSIVTTFDGDVPDDIRIGPWELRRGIGPSFGHNRAEREEHQMTGVEIVDLFTEVVAKGGHLLLAVGPAADGTIPEMQAAPLRDAGTWIRRHQALISNTSPWTSWGDADARYLKIRDGGSADDKGAEAPQQVAAIDVSGTRAFPALGERTCRVSAVEIDGYPTGDDHHRHVKWEQDEGGLRILPDGSRTDGEFFDDGIGIPVYRITIESVEPTAELFPMAEPAATALGPLLADAQPGSIIQLGDGLYEGPVVVPARVTLRGFGPSRTIISNSMNPLPSIVPTAPAVTLLRGARLEHLSVVGRSSATERPARPLVKMSESEATVLGVSITGSIEVSADDVLIRAVAAQGVVATDADRLHVSRCYFSGNHTDVGVELRGGGGHQIESSEFVAHLCAVRLTATTGSTVRGNMIAARWWGVHLRQSEGTHVHANRMSDTMRAVDIDGGTEIVIDGNAVVNGDSGCIVQDGASKCEVHGNHWDRCRIGLLVWGDVELAHQDNVCSSLHDEDGALVTGP